MSKWVKSLQNLQGRTPEEAAAADVIYTPPSLARALVEEINLPVNVGSILDPCSGERAFFDAFPDHAEKFECEIQRGSDFFEWTQPVEWVVSNPPFSKITMWIDQTLTVAQAGFAYLLPVYSLTHRRLNKIESFGFFCTDVVEFENPKSWNIGFQMAFFIFRKGGARNFRIIGPTQAQQKTLEDF